MSSPSHKQPCVKPAGGSASPPELWPSRVRPLAPLTVERQGTATDGRLIQKKKKKWNADMPAAEPGEGTRVKWPAPPVQKA